MTSNFDFARAAWPGLAEECVRAESYGRSDPRTSVFYARRVVEQLVDLIYQLKKLPEPYRDDLAARLGEAAFQQATGPEFVSKATLLRKAGNAAVHQSRPIGAAVALAALEELFDLVVWTFFRFSTRPDATPLQSTFDTGLVPDAVGVPQRSRDQLAALAAQPEARDAAIADARAANENLQTQLETLRAQVAAAQAAKTVAVDTHDYSEARTRSRFVDADLREAGWEPDDADVASTRWPACPAPTAPASRTTCSGARMGSRWR